MGGYRPENLILSLSNRKETFLIFYQRRCPWPKQSVVNEKMVIVFFVNRAILLAQLLLCFKHEAGSLTLEMFLA